MVLNRSFQDCRSCWQLEENILNRPVRDRRRIPIYSESFNPRSLKDPSQPGPATFALNLESFILGLLVILAMGGQYIESFISRSPQNTISISEAFISAPSQDRFQQARIGHRGNEKNFESFISESLQALSPAGKGKGVEMEKSTYRYLAQMSD
jgi:hypothetical protein